LALIAQAACAHQTTPPPQAAVSEYRLGREDVVSVEVWKEPTLSAKVPVRPDGCISLPMVGEVRAEGRTAQELEREIAERLTPVVREPVVAVMVAEVNAARFFVLGEVAHPGAYPARGVVSVLQALAMAGGPTEWASKGSIVVIRPAGGGEQRYRVNYDRVVAGKARAIQLVSGDTVFVP
jgi:polysaccharide export outer membrane protein